MTRSRTMPTTTRKLVSSNIISRKSLLNLFNCPLVGYKCAIYHQPSRKWFFGLILKETRNTFQVLSWRFLEGRISSPSKLDERCIREIFNLSEKILLKYLDEQKKQRERPIKQLISDSCAHDLSLEHSGKMRIFTKKSITIFVHVSRETHDHGNFPSQSDSTPEIFVKMDGKILIGRPWERFVKPPRKRW